MYNKLFSKILDSSIWLEHVATRVVWITLLAAMDEDGLAHFSAIENLARRANIPAKDTERAVKILEAPDPQSGDPEFEGRRIERVSGGWKILNAGKYRDIYNREIQREKTRVRVARHRENVRNTSEVTQSLLLASDTEVDIEYKIVWRKSTSFSGISERDRKEWAIAYPACDLDRQLAAMHQWLLANPLKAKKSNWRKFITTWLSKQQDRGGDMRNGGSSSAQRKSERASREYPSNVDTSKIVR